MARDLTIPKLLGLGIRVLGMVLGLGIWVLGQFWVWVIWVLVSLGLGVLGFG